MVAGAGPCPALGPDSPSDHWMFTAQSASLFLILLHLSLYFSEIVTSQSYYWFHVETPVRIKADELVPSERPEKVHLNFMIS